MDARATCSEPETCCSCRRERNIVSTISPTTSAPGWCSMARKAANGLPNRKHRSAMKTPSKTDLKDGTAHAQLIVDQFTRQAVPFSTAKPIADQQALQLLLEFSNAGPDDRVLDVACGGGNVVCAFAAKVHHATGIDMTPAMLARARSMAKDKG